LRARIADLPPISVPETLSVAPGIVDLWWWLYEPVEDAELWAAWEKLMSPEERQRHGNFRFSRDRRLFVATRALVRTTLSRYVPVPPADWRFVLGPTGKPRIGSPIVAPAIHFNLANTPGLVVCAVSVAHAALGVDAEQVDPNADLFSVAERYFSPLEAGELRALPPCERPHRFAAYWTLKESYIKARGLGLDLPLDKFYFLIGDDLVRIVFDSSTMSGDPERWRFALLDLPSGHKIAVGVDTGGASLCLRATQVLHAL
jgi:4'-phosphopantetheinyl transferase